MLEVHMLAASIRASTETVSLLSPWRYLGTQCGVILYYLRLCVVPYPLCLDYAWPVAERAVDIVWPGIVVVGLGLATVWAIVRRHPLGFVGGWFWLSLGPSSSILPIPDLAFEYRMYLPLAAVVVGGMAVGIGMGSRFAGEHRTSNTEHRTSKWRRSRTVLLTAYCLLLTGLGVMTHVRNRDYRSVGVMARDVVGKRPENYRQHIALIAALLDRGAVAEAEAQARALVARTDAKRKDPPRFPVAASDAHYYYAVAQNQLGRALLCQARGAEAMRHFEAAREARPAHKVTHYNTAVALYLAGDTNRALEWCEWAVTQDPGYAKAHALAARLLAESGSSGAAIKRYRVALALNPHLVRAKLELLKLLEFYPDEGAGERED